MRARMFHDDDADPTALDDRRVAFIGFGNQGAAQAANLRDSGIGPIRVGNLDDDYAAAAREAGFEVVAISEAAGWGDVVVLLIPDEVQPAVFNADIAPHLKDGSTLVVASGYNVAFDLLDISPQVNVVMAAPRMIGAGVRNRYVRGEPFPCFVSVEHDATGDALAVALAFTRGIGGTRGGAVESSAREEVALDLFSEQALWPTFLAAMRAAYEVLADAGFSDDAILYEMYLSKEPAEVFEQMADGGLFGQLSLHSQTSQFGQLRALERYDPQPLQERFARVLHDDILSGRFAQDWSDVQERGSADLEALRARAVQTPIAEAEGRVREGG